MMRALITILLLQLLLPSATNAQVWQWSVPVEKARNADARAYLWIPEKCRQVRGVVVTQNNMEELSIVENAYFRKKMAALSFAIIWVSPAFDLQFRFNEGAGDRFHEMMTALADASGYAELVYAPILPMGHSAAASWPYYFGAWNPQRTLACISVSGQWPYFRDARFAPDIWSATQNIDYIPSLETMGEYEAANTWSREGLKQRSAHPQMPLSMLACPAEGHFAATDKKVRYIALYIQKAAQYRLPRHYPDSSAPLLRPVDPVHTGWLMDKWRQDQLPAAASAPVGRYKGDTAQAFWFFDKQMVRATERYEAAYRGKKAQLTGYVQEGRVAPQRNSHLQVEMPFRPLADGITFVLKGILLDTVPGGSPRPATWTGLPAGAAIGHAGSQEPVAIQKIIGPFRKLNDTTFQLSLEKGLPSNPVNYMLTLAATHPGDDHYKPAVQQAQVTVPARNTTGIPQEIRFDSLANVQKRIRTVPLRAASSAGLPVHFYVEEGPAYCKGDTLVFTRLPPHSKWPVKVTVVAWQYGHTGPPAIQTAPPVVRSFYRMP